MNKILIVTLKLTLSIAVLVGTNYLFALAGEPRSLWLMNLLGLI